MNQPDPSGAAMRPVFVEDLILTDAFLVKGRLPNKSRRLTDMLEDHVRTFLQVQDATMISLRSPEVIRTPSVMINVNEVILAHELVEVAGDEALRRLSARSKPARIRAFHSGAVQFELAGNVEPAAYETIGNGRKYFVMQQPVLRGLDLANPELAILKHLEYVIVRKDKMAYVYDFS
jgi:Family of unknown function (DUF6812)